MGTSHSSPAERAEVIAGIIAAESEAIHRGGRLTPVAHQALVDADLFRICGPAQVGGEECDLEGVSAVAEILGRSDISTGWLFVQANATVYNFGPRLDAATAAEVFRGPASVVAAGFPVGQPRAEVVEGGYRVSGRWDFASGSLHSDWFDARVVVYDQGERKTTRSGLFGLMSCLVPRDEVTLVDTWDVTGMRGTGSQTYTVDNVFVPERRIVPMWEMAKKGSAGAFGIPALTFAHVAFAALTIGGASAALEWFRDLAQTKTAAQSRTPLRDQGTTQRVIGESHARLRAASAYRNWVVDRLMAAAGSEAGVTLADRAEARLAVTSITEASLAVVEALYRVAGTTGIFQSSPLHRIFNDLHVMSQQLFARPFHYENVGRYLLGLEHDRSIM
jgi:alkylation response protein AidB-like acyl-CoA dehydrogenase